MERYQVVSNSWNLNCNNFTCFYKSYFGDNKISYHELCNKKNKYQYSLKKLSYYENI